MMELDHRLSGAGRKGGRVRALALNNRRVGSDGKAMRLLVVSRAFPYPTTNGYSIRTWGVLRGLAANGHEIHLLSFGETAEIDVHAVELRRVCRTVEVVPHVPDNLSSGRNYFRRLGGLLSELPYAAIRYRSQAMKVRIEAWLHHHTVDAVLCDTPFPLASFPAVLPIPFILNNHNIEHVILQRYLAHERNPARRAYAQLEWSKLRRWERQAWSRADLVLVCSEHDRLATEELCPGTPVAVVPNVVDVDSYVPDPYSNGSTVLYAGGMDWYPNRDAVQYFVSTILPELRRHIPGVRFVVAGRTPSEKFRRRFSHVPGVEFTGTVPDLRPEISRATVCVVPLRIGSGTRLKILEAAAMAKPIVSTTVGVEGLDFVDGHDILIADRPAEFAAKIADLLRNPAQRESLGWAARRRVECHYSFSVLRTAVHRALQMLTDKSP